MTKYKSKLITVSSPRLSVIQEIPEHLPHSSDENSSETTILVMWVTKSWIHDIFLYVNTLLVPIPIILALLGTHLFVRLYRTFRNFSPSGERDI